MEWNKLSPQVTKQVESQVNNFNIKLNKNRVSSQEEMGKNEFLKILTVQLAHQNPLKPMDNTQFISQMAQFSSLEQMQNINKTLGDLKGDFSDLKGTSLIGKQAHYTDFSGIMKSGMIDEIRLKDNEVVINGDEVALKDLISIKAGNHPVAKSYENNVRQVEIKK